MAQPTTPSSAAASADDKPDHNDIESGYASAHSDYSPSPSQPKTRPKVSLTKEHVAYLNQQMERMHPMDILRFCKVMFPNLYQSTAFGLTGLATLDMLSKIHHETPGSKPVELIFLDTLYHFRETYDLVERVRERYPEAKVHVFKPYDADTTAEFEQTYGEELYKMSGDMYDWIVKVEPLERAYDQLKVAAARGSIPVIEYDDERGIIKINPLATWTFSQVNEYIRENKVPYNALLDRGYKSVGDWHSTSPVGEGDDERAGRWKGQSKTECGIHNRRSRYARFAGEPGHTEESGGSPVRVVAAV